MLLLMANGINHRFEVLHHLCILPESKKGYTRSFCGRREENTMIITMNFDLDDPCGPSRPPFWFFVSLLFCWLNSYWHVLRYVEFNHILLLLLNDASEPHTFITIHDERPCLLACRRRCLGDESSRVQSIGRRGRGTTVCVCWCCVWGDNTTGCPSCLMKDGAAHDPVVPIVKVTIR